MNTRYDLLLCDADDTLFDFGRAEENAFADACARMGLEATDALLKTYSDINAALWRLLEQGGITQAVLRVRRFEQFLEKIGRSDLDAQRMATAFTDSLGRQSVPIDGAVEAVARWSRIVPVIIVTNGIARVQHGRMDGSEVRHYIRGMVVSEEVGAAKPDPKMIEIGMEMAGVQNRSRVLMLGDSLSSDIAAAANAGVDACWYNPHGKAARPDIQPDFQFSRLEQLPALLEEIGKAP